MTANTIGLLAVAVFLVLLFVAKQGVGRIALTVVLVLGFILGTTKTATAVRDGVYRVGAAISRVHL